MLRFIFSILVVLLDQFFKRWIVITLDVGQETSVIPGLLSLFHLQNTGAAFSFMADQRWMLAGIQFAAAFVLIMILLRYTDGFWGTLGLAAVLGGTIGNLIDRVFLGYVVDMFRFLFVDFAIFNIADIFITLGFATFLIHFIVSSFRSDKKRDMLPAAAADSPHVPYDYPSDAADAAYPDMSGQPSAFPDNAFSGAPYPGPAYPELSYTDAAYSDTAYPDAAYPDAAYADSAYAFGGAAQPEPPMQDEFQSDTLHFPIQGPAAGFDANQYPAQDPQAWFDTVPEQAPLSQIPETPPGISYPEPPQADNAATLDVLSALESELMEPELLADYDVDKLLSEYGFDSDDR